MVLWCNWELKDSFWHALSYEVTVKQFFLGSLLHMTGYSCLHIHSAVKATSVLIDVTFTNVILGTK